MPMAVRTHDLSASDSANCNACSYAEDERPKQKIKTAGQEKQNKKWQKTNDSRVANFIEKPGFSLAERHTAAKRR